MWDNALRDVHVAAVDPGHLLGRLKAVQATFDRACGDRWHPYASYGHGYAPSACSTAAKEVVADFIKSIEKKLSEVYSVELDD